MGEVTKIEWCDHTFNPWIGCAKVSPGCKHCYAETDTPARVAPGVVRALRDSYSWADDSRRDRGEALEELETFGPEGKTMSEPTARDHRGRLDAALGDEGIYSDVRDAVRWALAEIDRLTAERDDVLAYAAFLQVQSTTKPDYSAWTAAEAVAWVVKVAAGTFHRLAWSRNDIVSHDACKEAVEAFREAANPAGKDED